MKKNSAQPDERCHEDVMADTAVLRRIMRQSAENVPPVSSDLFARIEAQIDGQQTITATIDKGQEKTLLTGIMTPLRQFFSMPQVGWGVAAVQAVGIALFVAFYPANQAYQTLSAEQYSAEQANRQTYYLMFSREARQGDIEQLLQDVGGSIINGPGERGIFTLHLADQHEQSRVTRQEILQQSSLVTFFEKSY